MKNILSILLILTSFLSIGQIDRTKAPSPQPSPIINIPSPKIHQLENGLKVIVVENHKLPKISFQLQIDNPTIKEGEKAGVSDLFGDMLGTGTESISKNDFNETIDYIGASFRPNSNGFYASSLTKHSTKLLELLKSVLLESEFSDDEFEKLKKLSLTNLSSMQSNADAMAKNVGKVINFGKNHAYGEVITEKSVDLITLEDIKAYYESYFRPNNAYLVIVGDVNEEEGVALANSYFGNWKANTYPLAKQTQKTPVTSGNNVIFVDKPGAVQSVIKITSALDIKPGHPDAIKLSVLNSILGGGSFSARLMSNLREDKAYTYGCYSRVSTDKIMGSFSAGGSFRNDVTDSAITQILYEINRICNEMVSDEELDLTKKSRTGSFARALENPQTIARFALNTVKYNLPENYYADYLKSIEKITKEDLLAVAKKYLHPENLSIIVVGNKNIADKLIQFDKNKKIDWRDGFGRIKETLKKVSSDITIETVITNYLNAVYQSNDAKVIAKKNKKIKFIHKTYTGMMPQRGLTFDLVEYSAFPNSEGMKLSANGQTVQKEYFNGSIGYMESRGGPKPYTKEEVNEHQVFNFPVVQAHYLNNDKYSIKLLGIETIKTIDYYKMEVTNNLTESISHEYYDVNTNLLMIKEKSEKTDNGTNFSKLIYSDYKSYGKKKYTLLLPSVKIIENAGMIFNTELKSVVFSKKIPTTIFEGDY